MRKVISIFGVFALIFLLTGCSSKNVQNTNNVVNTGKLTNTSNTSKEEKDLNNIDYAVAAEKQMAIPEKGEQIVIFHIKDYGQVKAKFFKDVAPKAVENFITHAQEGYYDGVVFHRVINEFMIQGGDPTGNGTGGESIWGKGFEEEFSYEIAPYRGSLCMASKKTGTSTLGSQFFITQSNYSESMESYMDIGGYPKGLLQQYKTYGGYLSLYLQYTIFGQVFEGIDLVDRIAMVDTDGNDKPVVDVIIEKVEITTY